MKLPRNAAQGLGNPANVDHRISSPIDVNKIGGARKDKNKGNGKYLAFRRRMRKDLCR